LNAILLLADCICGEELPVQASCNSLMNDQEKQGRTQKNSVLERAKDMMDENMDDVKHMNQMMLYSKVVTIRDAQIQEKRQVQAEKEEEEKMLKERIKIKREVEKLSEKILIDMEDILMISFEAVKMEMIDRAKLAFEEGATLKE